MMGVNFIIGARILTMKKLMELKNNGKKYIDLEQYVVSRFSLIVYFLILLLIGASYAKPRYKKIATMDPVSVLTTFSDYYKESDCADSKINTSAKKLISFMESEPLNEQRVRENYLKIALLLRDFDLKSNCNWQRNNYAITDIVVATSLISLMKYDESDTLKQIITFLMDYDLIRYFSAGIKENIGDLYNDPNFHKVRLWALTELSDIEKGEILAKKNLPREVSARLGDTVIEHSLIKRYENCKSYIAKEYYLDTLSYVRTPKCVNAIIRSMDSIELTHYGYATNKRFPYTVITYSLRRIFPREDLFKEKLDTIYKGWYEGAKNPAEKHDQYIKEIIKWARKNDINLKLLELAEDLVVHKLTR